MLFAALAALGVASAAGPGRPGGPDDPPETLIREARGDYPKPDRKTPSFWRRKPAQETPKHQRALAVSLAQSERLRAASRTADRLVRHWHDSPEAVEAQLLLARMLEQRNRLPKAFEAYQYLIAYYPGRFDYETVVERQFQITETLRERLGRRLNLTLSEARVRRKYARVLRNAPFGSQAAAAQLAVAQLFEADNDLDDAILAYEALVARYPDSPQAMEAAFRTVECRYRLARRHARDESLSVEALSAVLAMQRAYPGHPQTDTLRERADWLYEHLAELHYEQAAFYDRIQQHPDSARIAYTEFLRRFPDSRRAAQVRKRLVELGSPVDDGNRFDIHLHGRPADGSFPEIPPQ